MLWMGLSLVELAEGNSPLSNADHTRTINRSLDVNTELFGSDNTIVPDCFNAKATNSATSQAGFQVLFDLISFIRF